MKPIWKKPISLEWLAQISDGSLVSHLGIEFLEIGPDFLRARMPVDSRTKQPIGLLHGGASVALAETVASTASHCCVDEEHYFVGIEINANYVRKVKSGWVEALARPLHLGQSTHVWEMQVTDENGLLISTCRMTLSVLEIN